MQLRAPYTWVPWLSFVWVQLGIVICVGNCVGNFAANDSPRRDSQDPGLQCDVVVDAVISTIPDRGMAIQTHTV